MTRIKEISNEVIIAQDSIVQADRVIMNDLKARAARSLRHRARLCAHKSAEDRLHEMLIVLSKQVYIRPHRHTNKSESFHVIQGSAIVIFFNDAGKIEEVIKIGDRESGACFYFRNDDSRYHTQIVTSDFLVFHEITNGPFNPADTIFAPWAPEENNVAAANLFKEKLSQDAASLK